jgi:glutamyl-tRNA reductase
MRNFDEDVSEEVIRARRLHAPLNSAHEAYAVILEELDEFWDECRKKREHRNHHQMYRELVQVAAMATRAATDLRLPPMPDRSMD